MNATRTLTALAFAGAMSFASHAELITTDTQVRDYQGAAGNTSLEAGIDPFTFDLFDASLGTLTGVHIWYGMEINNGLIGADNLTNKRATGSGTLGGAITLSSELNFLKSNYTPIFNKLNVTQGVTFDLAADPTMSTGGTGPDVQSFNGGYFSNNSGWLDVNTNLLDQFYNTSADTFTIDFDTDSIVKVNVSGAQGFFRVVDADISVQMYYTYDAPEAPEPVPPVADVSAPLIGSACAAIFGFALYRRKKAKNTR